MVEIWGIEPQTFLPLPISMLRVLIHSVYLLFNLLSISIDIMSHFRFWHFRFWFLPDYWLCFIYDGPNTFLSVIGFMHLDHLHYRLLPPLLAWWTACPLAKELTTAVFDTLPSMSSSTYHMLFHIACVAFFHLYFYLFFLFFSFP